MKLRPPVHEVAGVVSCMFHFCASREEGHVMRLVQASLVLLVYGPRYLPLTPPPPPTPAPHTYTPTHTAGFSETIIFGNLIHRPIEIRLFAVLANNLISIAPCIRFQSWMKV